MPTAHWLTAAAAAAVSVAAAAAASIEFNAKQQSHLRCGQLMLKCSSNAVHQPRTGLQLLLLLLLLLLVLNSLQSNSLTSAVGSSYLSVPPTLYVNRELADSFCCTNCFAASTCASGTVRVKTYSSSSSSSSSRVAAAAAAAEEEAASWMCGLSHITNKKAAGVYQSACTIERPHQVTRLVDVARCDAVICIRFLAHQESSKTCRDVLWRSNAHQLAINKDAQPVTQHLHSKVQRQYRCCKRDISRVGRPAANELNTLEV
jgi:hypothetical protein